ncbi:MAG: membrane integrity-associated transporter subunit PqiC [Burkholderiales bacterium]|nr:membrane integrity-associated transporter subunit PqiC [Burkholderiales bacterium]
MQKIMICLKKLLAKFLNTIVNIKDSVYKFISIAGWLSKIMVMGTLLSSCGILAPVAEPQIKEYQLVANSSDITSCMANPNAPILQVSPVKVFAPFDTRNMYYSESEYQLNSYALNRWSTHPGYMLNQAILQKLISTCTYSNVVNAEVMSVAKYRLVAQVMDFKQVINSNDATMNLTVLVQLIDNTSNMVMKSKTFMETLNVTPDPSGYIKGANAVVAQFTNDLALWLQS